MAFSDLTSNQMVTFTNAQSSGFALKAGQAHVTSNQCMTKSDALAKYNLSTSAMDGYASNQLVPRSAWVALSEGYQEIMTVGKAATTTYGYNSSGTPFGSLTDNTVPIPILDNGTMALIYYQFGRLTFAVAGLTSAAAPTGWTTFSLDAVSYLRTGMDPPIWSNNMWWFSLLTSPDPIGEVIGAQRTVAIT